MSPVVTHGHTFCTVEQFSSVSKAIDECAFILSELPVILSLEMHCSPKQQHALARMLVGDLGDAVLQFNELAATGQALSLSPIALAKRVLLKGKVNIVTKQNPLRQTRTTSHGPSVQNRRKSRSFGAGFCKSSVLGLSASRSQMTVTEKTQDEPQNEPETPRKPKAEAIKSSKKATDPFYSECIALRALPIKVFLDSTTSQWPLPISSINEGRLLKELAVPKDQRDQIEGLSSVSVRGGLGLSERQLSARAIATLAADPPPEVGSMQRKTTRWLVRPFPLGLRFSGKNMSPLPGWLAGSQNVALNMSNIDLPAQLHFALFKASGGFVLKPPEMCFGDAAASLPASRRLSAASSATDDERRDADVEYWPSFRGFLHMTTLELLSLHSAPERRERRPRFDGSRSACHQYCKELSGTAASPGNSNPLPVAVTVSLHPVGGFCAVSEAPSLAQHGTNTEHQVVAKGSGMNAAVGKRVYCFAAEPSATFLRVGVQEGGHDVAFEVAVLDRLRPGHRVFQMRGSRLGTRIELCCLFVKITFGSAPNVWVTARQASFHNARLEQELELLRRPSSTPSGGGPDQSPEFDFERFVNRTTLARSTQGESTMCRA